METRIATTIEQSKKLLELGLDVNTADMYYINGDSDKIIIGKWKTDAHDEDDLPCWSLSTLLKLIPNWQMQTQDDGIGILFGCKECIKIIDADTPLDAAFEMVVKLKENNYL